MDDAGRSEVGIAHQVERALADVGAALATDAESEPLPPALVLARMADVARSSLFLSLESALQVQERLVRVGTAPTLWPSAARWLPRALLITSVAVDLYTGYAVLRQRSSRTPWLVRPRDWELQHARGAARLLETSVALGGTLIKAGQIASVRGDPLPRAYIKHLATLQDRVPPHPWADIRAALTRELGRSPEDLFARLDPRPVAAASLSQVHRATLRDGREVAVKVQYPEIRDIVSADLAALSALVGGLAHVEPSVRLGPVLDHLRSTLPLELDFAHEAAAMPRLRTALAERSDVIVPEVISELCTPRVLVMRFVEGTKITDLDGLARAGIDRRAVARLLNDVYAEQMLQRGVLHADPHPGNLLVQPGPRLVLLDHGLTIDLRPGLAEALASMVRAASDGDVPALSNALVALGFPAGASTDLGSLLEFAGVLMGGGEPDAASLGERLSQALGDVPLELLTVGRALCLLNGITRELDPHLDVLEIVGARAARAT